MYLCSWGCLSYCFITVKGIMTKATLIKEDLLSYIFEGPHGLFLKGVCVVWNEKCLP